MASIIATAVVCDSYLLELLKGLHTDSDVYKIALYTSLASLDRSTTSYIGASNEAIGPGYSAGGKVLTGFNANLRSGIACLDFDSVKWDAVTLTVRKALIYNSTATGKNAVCVLIFSEDVSDAGGVLQITMPTPPLVFIQTFSKSSWYHCRQ